LIVPVLSQAAAPAGYRQISLASVAHATRLPAEEFLLIWAIQQQNIANRSIFDATGMR